MRKEAYNAISVYLFLIGLAWVIYTIFAGWGTECFDVTKAYITILVLIIDIIWNNFVRYS